LGLRIVRRPKFLPSTIIAGIGRRDYSRVGEARKKDAHR